MLHAALLSVQRSTAVCAAARPAMRCSRSAALFRFHSLVCDFELRFEISECRLELGDRDLRPERCVKRSVSDSLRA